MRDEAGETLVTEHFFGAGADGADTDKMGAARPRVEDALRFVSSVQDWAESWAERNLGEPTQGHSGSDCRWCPLCQFVAVLRGERPEVTERVAEAGTALAAALRALVDAASSAGGMAGQPRHPRPSPAPRVQKINLSDES